MAGMGTVGISSIVLFFFSDSLTLGKESESQKLYQPIVEESRNSMDHDDDDEGSNGVAPTGYRVLNDEGVPSPKR